MIPAPCKLRYFTDRGWHLGGVVHVGANDGEEIPDYLALGLSPILAIEPNPDVFAELERLTADWPSVIAVNAALGERTEGARDLFIPGHLHDGLIDDSKSATLLGPQKRDDPGHRVGRFVSVPVLRFDELVRYMGIDLGPFDTLVVDVEGMEAQVLRGFGEELERFSFLNIECSESPWFDDQAPAWQVVAFLEARGFEQLTPIEPHNDILFRRVS